MIAFLGAIAVLAAIVRGRRELELAIARPAQRLAALSASLAAASSVEDVKAAFVATTRNDLGANQVRFALIGGSVDPSDDGPAPYVAPLVVGSSELGRVEVWFDDHPNEDTAALLDQAVAQVSVALGRAQSDREGAITARRLAALQRSTSRLAGLLRTDDIAHAMVVEARAALQADRAVFHVLDGDRIDVLATDGEVGPLATMEIGHPGPIAEAIRTGQLIVHESRGSAEDSYPDLEAAAVDDDHAFLTAPISGRRGQVAALHLGFDRSRRIDEEDRHLLGALVTLIGAASRRASRFEDEERERVQSVSRAERAARLADFAAKLAEAQDRHSVAVAFAESGLATVDASWGGLFERDAIRDVLRVVSGQASGAVWADGATIPLDGETALTEAVRECRLVTMGTREEVLARHPGEVVHPSQQARAAVPLLAHGSVIGALGFAWSEPHVFDDAEVDFLRSIATRTSEALERGRLYEAERDDKRRWSLLAEASAVLAEALEPRELLRALARWAVPQVADLCTVFLGQPDGTAAMFTSVDLPEAEAAAELLDRERIDLASEHPVARLYRSRRTLHLENLTAEIVTDAVGGHPSRVELISALGIRQVVSTPLIAREEQLGLLLLGVGRSGRVFSDADIDLVADLGARFAIVFENARLLAIERNVAARLQSALLPTSLEPPPGLDVAVRYAASGSRAGGDWYDLIRFSDTTAALVVGDLVGHGVEAAATMSRYRSALRAHARMFADPAEVMNAYSSFIRLDDEKQTATVLYCRIDLESATLSYCSAGHPPPILLHEGRCHVLPSPQGPLIGLVSGGYATRSVELPRGALVVLYTDGLLERRHESLDEGMRRLERAITSTPADDLDVFVDRLLATMNDAGHDDDVAVVVARNRWCRPVAGA